MMRICKKERGEKERGDRWKEEGRGGKRRKEMMAK